MNEQRLNDYLELIQTLLACPKGQELAVLQANPSLVDLELVQTMEQVAAQMTGEDDARAANFLRTWAEELRNALAQPRADTKHPKNGDRTTAYMDLIKELLSCRKGSEPEILQAHWELVDTGLIQQMEQVAAMLVEKGDQSDANFLFSLAHQLTETVSRSSNTQRSLLKQILQAIQDNDGNPQAIYPLLQKNLTHLDASFVQTLQDWAKETLLATETQHSIELAADLVIFADLIRQFPLQKFPQKDPSDLLEIALISYQIALPMFSRETFPQQWAMIQQHTGETYYHRIKGDKAENIESAIHCFHAALQGYTRDATPHDWAFVQQDLGEAYRHRIRGERTENLEHAVAAYAEALQMYTHRSA